MWLELTELGTKQAVCVNTDLVTHMTDLPQGAAPGCKLFFSNALELIVSKRLERIMEHLQLI